MNMFKPTKATTIEGYMAAIPDGRRAMIEELDALIRRTVPSLSPWFTYNMLGYGSFPYVNYKNETVEWPIIALASQKQYVSLYVCALDGKRYLAEKYKKELGNVSVGKSCIRIKKMEDLNVRTVAKILREAAKKPGLVSAAMKK